MTEANNIEIIRKQINSLDDELFDMNTWVMTTDNYLKNIWGNDTPKSKQLYAICNTMSAGMFGASENDVVKFKSQWKNLLNGYIIELENLKKPETNKRTGMNSINLTVNQNQTQSQEQTQKQTIDIEVIINALKDELTGKQLKELDSIIKEPESSDKGKKVVEKILSFGLNVTAGILGNILTNPQIVGLI